MLGYWVVMATLAAAAASEGGGAAAPEELAAEPGAGEADPSAGAEDAPASSTAPTTELQPLEELPPLEELEPLEELAPLPAMADGADEEDEGPRTDTAAEEDDEPTLRDVMTGSLRLVGAFLHFDDLPELYPNGDDGLFATVARVMVNRRWDNGLSLEINYFGELSRSPAVGSNTGGAFGTAGTTDSVYRSPFLSWPLWEDGSIRGGAGVDRFALGATFGPASLRVGRFPVTYSVTSFFTPNDFLAPFSVTAVNRIYKPGVDAISVGSALGMRGSVEVVGAMGNDAEGTPTWGRSALLARASVLGGGFEWAALGGKVAERWVVGGSFQGSIRAVGLHGEAHVGFPDVEGNGRDEEDTAPVHVRLAAGPSLNVGWKGLALGGEYAFYSDGAGQPEDLVPRVQRFFPDDVPLLGRHYVGVNAGMEIIPILRAGLLGLVSGSDGSGLAGLSLSYSVADEADLIGGVFLPWGDGPQLTGNPMMPVALGSEMGASPVSVYVEARTFF